MLSQKNNCYCAFCKKPRWIPKNKHVSGVHFIGAISFALFLSYAWKGGIDGRALVFFVCLLGIMEIGVQMKWRLSVPCPHCGFDPVLYVKNRQAACDKVKRHQEELLNTPLGLLKAVDNPQRSPLPLPEGEAEEQIQIEESKVGSVGVKELN